MICSALTTVVPTVPLDFMEGERGTTAEFPMFGNKILSEYRIQKTEHRIEVMQCYGKVGSVELQWEVLHTLLIEILGGRGNSYILEKCLINKGIPYNMNFSGNALCNSSNRARSNLNFNPRNSLKLLR